MIHAVSLEAVIGNIQYPTPINSISASTRQARGREQASNTQHPKLKSPGLLKKHYSPKAKLFVLNWRDEKDLRFQLSTLNPVKRRGPHGALCPQPSTCFIIAHTHIPSAEYFARVSVIPHDAEAFARTIYAELHRCDEAGAELIVVETPPVSPEWSGIADRLRRASA
jgi:L-threonylcarbamoyladenylate synthase